VVRRSGWKVTTVQWPVKRKKIATVRWPVKRKKIAAVRWPVKNKKLPAVRLAALGAIGMLAVAGCGSSGPSWWRPGAAALYDNARIPATQLASEVANLNASYQVYKARLGTQLRYKPSDMPRQALSWLLRFAIIEQLRAREGIHVTATQAQQAQNSYARLLRQQGATLAEFAVSIGMPPNMLPEFSRLIVIQSKLVNRLDHGTPPPQGSPAAQTLNLAISHLQCVAAKSLNIQVNPQFGMLDYGTYTVVPVPSELPTGQGATQAARSVPRC
jgi:hypothetical protein